MKKHTELQTAITRLVALTLFVNEAADQRRALNIVETSFVASKLNDIACSIFNESFK